MATVSGVLSGMSNIAKAVVPLGVDPIYFFATFIIMIAIVFVILSLLPFFKDKSGIRFLIAAVIAYFTAGSAFVTVIIAKLFPNIGLVLMGILGLLMVVAFVTPGSFEDGNKLAGGPFIIIIAFIIVIYLTYAYAAPELQKAGFISEGLGTGLSNEDMSLVLAIVIVLGIVGIIIYSGKTPKPPLAHYLFGRQNF